MPDPDYEISGVRSSRTLDKGGGGAVSKKMFSALRASVWSKNKGGPDPFPRSATAVNIPIAPRAQSVLSNGLK